MMTSNLSRCLFAIILLAGLPLVTANGAERETVSTLLARLANEPLDGQEHWALETVLGALEDQPPDPRIIPALESAFKQKDSKGEKQVIAATLLHLSVKSDRYFDLLAGYAKEAIEDHTPFFLMYDANGRVVKGQWNPDFERWCEENGRDKKEVGAWQFQAYPEDVRFLASVRDPRARDLLKRGLESQNPLVVYYSAEGLVGLYDVSAIPLIIKACERLPAEDSITVARILAEYMTPDADRAMERFVKDPRLRAGYKREALQKRIDQTNRARRRKTEENQK